MVLDFSPRLTQKETLFHYVRGNLTDTQLEAADGSGALMIVETIRLSVGPKSSQEASCSVVVGFLQTRFSSTKLW